MNTEVPVTYPLRMGPVEVDSRRPVAELGCLFGVLALLVIFKWVCKRI